MVATATIRLKKCVLIGGVTCFQRCTTLCPLQNHAEILVHTVHLMCCLQGDTSFDKDPI